MSGHAPQSLDNRSSKEHFWSRLRAATQSAKRKYPKNEIILAIDANARVGSILQEGIAPIKPDIENENGEF